MQSHNKLHNWHADSSRRSIVQLSRERTTPRILSWTSLKYYIHFSFILKLIIFIYKQLKRPVAFSVVHKWQIESTDKIILCCHAMSQLKSTSSRFANRFCFASIALSLEFSIAWQFFPHQLQGRSLQADICSSMSVWALFWFAAPQFMHQNWTGLMTLLHKETEVTLAQCIVTLCHSSTACRKLSDGRSLVRTSTVKCSHCKVSPPRWQTMSKPSMPAGTAHWHHVNLTQNDPHTPPQSKCEVTWLSMRSQRKIPRTNGRNTRSAAADSRHTCGLANRMQCTPTDNNGRTWCTPTALRSDSHRTQKWQDSQANAAWHSDWWQSGSVLKCSTICSHHPPTPSINNRCESQALALSTLHLTRPAHELWGRERRGVCPQWNSSGSCGCENSKPTHHTLSVSHPGDWHMHHWPIDTSLTRCSLHDAWGRMQHPNSHARVGLV